MIKLLTLGLNGSIDCEACSSRDDVSQVVNLNDLKRERNGGVYITQL